MTPEERHEALTLLLDGNRTIRTAADTHALLLRAVRDNAALEIDCRTTAEADLSFIQLLLAARASARAIRLLHPLSDALRSVLDRGGFLDPAAPERDFWQRAEAA